MNAHLPPALASALAEGHIPHVRPEPSDMTPGERRLLWHLKDWCRAETEMRFHGFGLEARRIHNP